MYKRQDLIYATDQLDRCLMYIAQGLRYDIIYATDQLARPMSKPSKLYLVAAKHALRYLAGTTDFQITNKKKRFQARCLLRLELGQQPRQREVDLVLSDDASDCSG